MIEGGNFCEWERILCVKKIIFKLYIYRGRRFYGCWYFNVDDVICVWFGVKKRSGNGYGCCCVSKGYYNRVEVFWF